MISKSYCILVASTSPARDRIVQRLNDHGLTCEIADTGAKIIDSLSANVFDLILADYALEDMDIWRLSTIVRSGRIGASIPIVLLQDPEEIPIPSTLTRDFHFTSFSLRKIDDLPNFIDGYLTKRVKPSLLIIEDHADAIEIAEYALKDEYSISVATNGENGFKAWLDQRHDLILLDLMLPDISGESILEQIVNTDPQQPVIVVTADGKIESYKKVLLNGAIQYISKPYDLDHLRRICRVTLNKARSMSEAESQQDLMALVAQHVWAASYYLKRGNIDNASQHLNKIMQAVPEAMPSEDARASLVSR